MYSDLNIVFSEFAANLDRHVRAKHTLEKMHACSQCDYKSVFKGYLPVHIFIIQTASYSKIVSYQLKHHDTDHSTLI